MSSSRASSLIRSRRQAGFSLVEALVGLVIMLMASSALMLSMQASVGSTQSAVDQVIAQGLARQLMEEIMLRRYFEPTDNPYSGNLQAGNAELAGPGRSLFDDTDDYNNWTASPPQDRYGKVIGTGNASNAVARPNNFAIPATQFNRWRQRVKVYYLNPATMEAVTSGGSYYRGIEVSIDRRDAAGNWQTLTTLKRVISYVPAVAT